MPEIFEALTWVVFLAVVWLAAPPLVAYRKGYAVAPWFCALGVIGVFALAFFPVLGRGEPFADRQRLETRATRVGWVLSVAGFLLGFGFCLSSGTDWNLIGFLAFVGLVAYDRMVSGPTVSPHDSDDEQMCYRDPDGEQMAP